ncbi:MAG: hypothetical protein IPI19_03085 [Ignavibacteriales bacterium]|nr:hypothetical protein [Ignavibacteriales bacterium]MBP9120487.1 hypothetical protein [Ignavibacterium sp.]
MKNISTISKVFAVLSLIAAAIWVGSYLSRLFLVYQLFEGPDLILKSYITNENVNGILFSILPSFVVHFIAFIVMFLSTTIFYLTSKINLRYNGWLFIILIAIIITIPFEIYLMLIDYKIIMMLNNGSFDSNTVISLLRDRIKDLSSYSIVAILTYLSFYYFIVFQPLTKKD